MLKTFEVKVVCEVVKVITCVCETCEQAKTDPYEYAVGGEEEIQQNSWNVVNVKEI